MSSEIPKSSKLDVQNRNYFQESGSDYNYDNHTSAGKQSQSIIISVVQEDLQYSQTADEIPNIPWSFLRWDHF